MINNQNVNPQLPHLLHLSGHDLCCLTKCFMNRIMFSSRTSCQEGILLPVFERNYVVRVRSLPWRDSVFPLWRASLNGIIKPMTSFYWWHLDQCFTLTWSFAHSALLYSWLWLTRRCWFISPSGFHSIKCVTVSVRKCLLSIFGSCHCQQSDCKTRQDVLCIFGCVLHLLSLERENNSIICGSQYHQEV